MTWTKCTDSMPPAHHSYRVLQRSETVLATDGKSIWMAYISNLGDAEWETWVIDGRDGYSIDHTVTHWMPLPELPNGA